MRKPILVLSSRNPMRRFPFRFHMKIRTNFRPHSLWSKEDLRNTVAGGELTWGLERDVNVAVRFGRAGETNAWTLLLAEEQQNVVRKGSLTDGRASYRIDGSRQLAGTTFPLMETAGFLLYDGTRLVAAVDLINAGSVMFSNDLSPSQRDPLAAAATALLLYRDISGD
jgi:hypothetical protein